MFRPHLPQAFSCLLAAVFLLAAARSPAFKTASRGYTITYHHSSISEKRGPRTEVFYRAEVRELASPDADGNNFAGTGRYTIHAVQQKANCHNGLPDDIEVIDAEGSLRAVATVSGPRDNPFLFFSLTPLSGPRLHLFTRSFRGLDKQVAESEEDLPYLASPAAGALVLAADSGGFRKEGGIGPNDCDGEISHVNAAQVVAIGPPCANQAPDLPPELDGTRDALVKGMQEAGYNVGPEHIHVSGGGITSFGIRLAEGGCVLPTIEAIKGRCPARGKAKGAKRLLVGGVQQAGGTTRVTARIVEAETAVVLQTAKADATGSGADATAAAMAGALKQLGVPQGCVE